MNNKNKDNVRKLKNKQAENQKLMLDINGRDEEIRDLNSKIKEKDKLMK